jgi:hypothetical protein
MQQPHDSCRCANRPCQPGYPLNLGGSKLQHQYSWRTALADVSNVGDITLLLLLLMSYVTLSDVTLPLDAVDGVHSPRAYVSTQGSTDLRGCRTCGHGCILASLRGRDQQLRPRQIVLRC